MRRLGDAVLAGLGGVNPKRAREARFRLVWTEAAGELIGTRASARLEGTRVVIDVVDERWAKEIAALSEPLRARLDAAVGDVREVVVRRVPMRTVVTRPRTVAPSPVPTRVTLATTSAVGAIRDVELRDLARRVAEHYLGRRKDQEKPT